MQEPSGKYFDIDNQELKRNSIRGSFMLLSAQLIKFLVQIATAIILARLVLPEDFGLFAIIFAVINFIAIFKEGGLTISTVQAENLNPRQLNTLFWLNSGLGLLLTLIAVLASWLTALIYADNRLFKGGAVLAATFLVIGLAAQPRALLRRQMAFTRLASVEVAAILGGSLAGLAIAWNQGGIWALVVSGLVTEIIGWLLVAQLSVWRPRFEFNWPESRPLVNFGGYLTIFDLIGYLHFSFDNLLIAWLWGSKLLSFYDKAYQFLLLPLNQLTIPLGRAVISTLSRVQDEPARFRQYFYRYALLLASLGMPLVVFVFGTADLLVPFVLGDNWQPSAELFKAFAPAAFCMTISPCVGWLYISLGRARRQLPWHAGIVIIWLIALAVTVRYGTYAVAVAFSLVRVLTLVPALIYASHNTPVRWSEILKSVFVPASASLGALGIMWGSERFSGNPDGVLAQLVIQASIFFASYLLIWFLVPEGRKVLIESFQHLRGAFRESVS